MKTICLNMIVKNESEIIERCLSTLKDTIDSWVIVDTGSTDGTQEIIRNYLKDVPGELHERPWVNFGHNRNEALDLARNKADYLLFVDADDQVIFLKSFQKSQLVKDFYMICVKRQSGDHFLPSIISNDPGWFWDGALHEHITHTRRMDGEILKEIVNESYAQDGNRSKDPQKYLKDAQILEAELERKPNDPRTLFYLAQSYEAAGDLEKSLAYYKQRILLEGEEQETFWSYYSMGRIQANLRMSQEEVVKSFCEAWQLCPLRAEPLLNLAHYFSDQGCTTLGYVLSKFANTLRVPNVLNTNFFSWMYEFGILTSYADNARMLKKYDEAREAYRELLKRKIPPDLKTHAERHLDTMPRETEAIAPRFYKKPHKSKR